MFIPFFAIQIYSLGFWRHEIPPISKPQDLDLEYGQHSMNSSQSLDVEHLVMNQTCKMFGSWDPGFLFLYPPQPPPPPNITIQIKTFCRSVVNLFIVSCLFLYLEHSVGHMKPAAGLSHWADDPTHVIGSYSMLQNISITLTRPNCTPWHWHYLNTLLEIDGNSLASLIVILLFWVKLSSRKERRRKTLEDRSCDKLAAPMLQLLFWSH